MALSVTAQVREEMEEAEKNWEEILSELDGYIAVYEVALRHVNVVYKIIVLPHHHRILFKIQ